MPTEETPRTVDAELLRVTVERFVADYAGDPDGEQTEGQRAAVLAMTHLLRSWRSRLPLDAAAMEGEAVRCREILDAFLGLLAMLRMGVYHERVP